MARGSDEKIAAIFRWADQDGDGILNRQECNRLIQVTEGCPLQDKDYIEACAMVEADPAVGLSLEQYRAIYEKSPAGGVDADYNTVSARDDFKDLGTFSVKVALMSGREVTTVKLVPKDTVSVLRLATSRALSGRPCQLTVGGAVLDDAILIRDAGLRDGAEVTAVIVNNGTFHICGNRRAFAALSAGGSVVAWGSHEHGGNIGEASEGLSSGVLQLFATDAAFAALKEGGSVVAWGNPRYGGDATEVAPNLCDGTREIFATERAFAALKEDGSLVTWGDCSFGGDSSAGRLSGSRCPPRRVRRMTSTLGAFAALQEDGSVAVWGRPDFGGDAAAVASQLHNVVDVFSTNSAFAAVRSDGSVVTWGDRGGNSSAVSASLGGGVARIFSNHYAFSALKTDGSVVTWGTRDCGGDSGAVDGQLREGVATIFATVSAFAALKLDGSVVTWGQACGGPGCSDGRHLRLPATSSFPALQDLRSGVTQIVSTNFAFAAVKADGSVVTWGERSYGGDSSRVAGQLQSVEKIFATDYAFAALRRDGSVVTWGGAVGRSSSGGDSSPVQRRLQQGVEEIISTQRAFAARKADGSVVTWGPANYGGDSSAAAEFLRS